MKTLYSSDIRQILAGMLTRLHAGSKAKVLSLKAKACQFNAKARPRTRLQLDQANNSSVKHTSPY